MAFELRLKENDSLILPRREVQTLLRGGDGLAALLYLQLVLSAGKAEETELCSALHWDHATLEQAAGGLVKLGLLGERAEIKEPAMEAPELAKPEYHRSDVAVVLEKDPGFAALRQEVARKLNRIFTAKDDEMLLGLYDYLGLPPDVIFLLVGHCVQRTERRYGTHRRPTMRQVEKEGYRWHRLGLMTQELAVEYLKEYAGKQEKIPQLMEALHLGDREPVSKELEFLERWIEWGFSPEAVEYAYEKTVFKCGKLEWKYLNGILKDWNKKNLHTVEEITAKDSLPRQDAPVRQEPKPMGGSNAPAEGVQDSVAWMKEYLRQTENE